PAIANEDRARGAGYNSALRFTSCHPNTVIIVVSADRPVSVIRNGYEHVNMVGTADSTAQIAPQKLQDWLSIED
ncbi:MAG: DNA-binding protein, partial [Desulfofustis sp.]|nr:DNA-binding protein [Desulfofustis sp.]